VTTTTSATAGERWMTSEVRRVPARERDAIARAAAKQVDAEYRSNPELTAFEVLGKDDLHVDNASTERRRGLAG